MTDWEHSRRVASRESRIWIDDPDWPSRTARMVISSLRLTSPELAYRHNGNSGQNNISSEEGFLDILKGAVKVGAPFVGGVLKTGLPMALGPLGGPLGALAGVALNAASKLAESAEAEAGGLDMTTINEGAAERAVLAEAALAALQTMELQPDTQESIFSDMKDF